MRGVGGQVEGGDDSYGNAVLPVRHISVPTNCKKNKNKMAALPREVFGALFLVQKSEKVFFFLNVDDILNPAV